VNVAGWVPLRWPCGPLEVERGRRRESFTATEAEALRAWADPQALEFLAGSPVNALVVPWAEGSAGDEDQQRALASLVGAARGRGLSVVGWVGEKADVRKAAGAARAAGLQALATESHGPVDGFEVLRFRRRGFDDRARSDFLGDADAVWPGMRPLKVERDVDAMTGATGRPWIDSNAWYVRLARSLLQPKAVWLAFDPPDDGREVPADAYRQAIADTEVGGARWLVSLDAPLRLGLTERRSEARGTWTAIGRTLAFFLEHRAWSDYAPVGQIGVLSDYTGANELLSFELLNLLARRNGLFRVLDKARAGETSFDGLDAVLYVDEVPPARDLVHRLYGFAEAGGTLIVPPGWETRGVPDERARSPRFRVFRPGRGRLAVAREAFAEPDLLAEDAQVLTSYGRDRFRVFNVGVGQFHYATRAGLRSGVLQVLAFPSPYPRLPATAWFRHPWASAREWRLEGEGAAPLPRAAVDGGVEFHLSPVPLYCAVEVSG
jgi:hypothetical protein